MTEINYNHTLPAFLSPKVVARELGVSLTAVYALIQSGDLRAVNVAPTSGQGKKRSYRIRPAWLDEFVSKRIIQRTRPQPPSRMRRRRRNRPPELSVEEYLRR